MPRNKVSAAFLVLSLTAAAMGVTAQAGEPETVTVEGEAFTGRTDSHAPARVITVDGTCHVLVGYEFVEAEMSGHRLEAGDTIVYRGVSALDEIPGEARVTCEDPGTGEEVTAVVPLVSTEYGNGRWTDGFEFPVTIYDYDSPAFVLGDGVVEIDPTAPLRGYEEELLALIGADPGMYRIDSIGWAGDQYTDADGTLCRDLTASGSMLVWDCEAVYEGLAYVPSRPGMKSVATYRPLAPPETAEETEPETETEEVTEAEPEPQTEEVTAAVTEPAAETFLERLFREWRESKAREELMKSAIGRMIVAAVDWTLAGAGHAAISLGSLTMILFGVIMLFITASGKRKTRGRIRKRHF